MSTVRRCTLFGVAFGACFPAASLALDVWRLGPPVPPLGALVAANPVQGIVLLAPLVLGAVFHLVGRGRAALEEALVAARAGERAKDEFLAVMSHEMRTPLNGVLGMAELLVEGGLDARQAGFARTIRESGEALLALVNDALDLAAADMGALRLAREPVALRALVEGPARLLAPLARAKGLALAVRVDPRLPPAAWGDAARLRRVVVNLLGNAIKFTEAGEVAVELGLAPAEGGAGPGPWLRLAVRDTGPGVAPEDQAAIFGRFVQADASRARAHEGTGLGLAITAELVALMGGRIGLSSAPGEGSTFWVTLPLEPAPVPAPVAAPAAPASGPEAQGPAGGGARGAEPRGLEAAPPALAAEPSQGPPVLVVDDNAVNRRLLAAILKADGRPHAEARDGREAVARFRALRPCAVLMDVSMPGMDGLEATRAIRAIEAEEGRAPCLVVGLTAHAREEDRRACLAAGMDAHHPKPVSPAALRRLLAGRGAGGARDAVGG